MVTDLTRAERQGICKLQELEAEPRCWRSFSEMGGRVVLRPDLFVDLLDDDYSYRFFIEVDMASESLPVVIRKCQVYEQYYRSGIEQAAHEVFPRVCWLVPNEVRAERLGQALERHPNLGPEMFLIATGDQLLATLLGGSS